MRKVLYQEIKETLEQEIIAGKYPLHSFLPSEKELAKLYDVSLITLRKAIEKLENEGYVKKRVAKGAEVISLIPLTRIARGQKFSMLLKNRGESLEKLDGTLEIIPNDMLDIFPNEARVYKFSRNYALNGDAYILETHFFPESEGKKIQFSDFGQGDSVYQLIYNAGLSFTRMLDEFRAISLTDEMKQQLQTDEAIGIKRIRNGFDQSGKIIHQMQSIYNTAVCPYLVEYKV